MVALKRHGVVKNETKTEGEVSGWATSMKAGHKQTEAGCRTEKGFLSYFPRV